MYDYIPDTDFVERPKPTFYDTEPKDTFGYLAVKSAGIGSVHGLEIKGVLPKHLTPPPVNFLDQLSPESLAPLTAEISKRQLAIERYNQLKEDVVSAKSHHKQLLAGLNFVESSFYRFFVPLLGGDVKKLDEVSASESAIGALEQEGWEVRKTIESSSFRVAKAVVAALATVDRRFEDLAQLLRSADSVCGLIRVSAPRRWLSEPIHMAKIRYELNVRDEVEPLLGQIESLYRRLVPTDGTGALVDRMVAMENRFGELFTPPDYSIPAQSAFEVLRERLNDARGFPEEFRAIVSGRRPNTLEEFDTKICSLERLYKGCFEEAEHIFSAWIKDVADGVAERYR